MNGKQMIVVVALIAICATFGCGYAADAVEKAVYEASPTPPTAWTDRITVEYKEAFWVRNGDGNISRVSLAGLTPLAVSPSAPQQCTIVAEKFGSGYDLVDCAPTEAFEVVAGEGLSVAR